MDTSVLTLIIVLSVFIVLQFSVLVFVSYQARQGRKVGDKIIEAHEQYMAQKEVESKIRALFNRRLNTHKALLLNLYEALEGAAKGATEEQTLKRLESFAAFAKNNPQRKP